MVNHEILRVPDGEHEIQIGFMSQSHRALFNALLGDFRVVIPDCWVR